MRKFDLSQWDKLIFLHQIPLHRARIHEDVKKRISKGEWIYDTIGDDSFVIGVLENFCVALFQIFQRKNLNKF
jgi:hypothetical protein